MQELVFVTILLVLIPVAPLLMLIIDRIALKKSGKNEELLKKNKKYINNYWKCIFIFIVLIINFICNSSSKYLPNILLVLIDIIEISTIILRVKDKRKFAYILLAILIICTILTVKVNDLGKPQDNCLILPGSVEEAFNSRWEQYAGVNKTAAEVQSLFSVAIAINASEKNSGTARYVKVTGLDGLDIDGAQNKRSIPSIVSNNTTYTVSLSYNESGLINLITVNAEKINTRTELE